MPQLAGQALGSSKPWGNVGAGCWVMPEARHERLNVKTEVEKSGF